MVPCPRTLKVILPAVLLLILLISLALLSAPLPGYSQRDVVISGQPTEEQTRAMTLMQEGVARLQLKRPGEAAGSLEQAQALWPTMPHVHYYLGFAYQESGQYARAIPEFQKAIAADAGRADCMVNIGTCYQLSGQPGQAADWFEKYIRLAPGSAKAQQAKAMIPQLRKQAAKLPAGGASGDARDYLQSVCLGGKPHRWPRQKFPLRVFIANGTNDQGQPVRGFNPEYNWLLYEAFQDWVKASGNRLVFKMVPNLEQADIICAWTDDPALAAAGGSGSEQGVAERYEQEMPDGSVAINASRVTVYVFSRTTGAPLAKTEMKKACLHEVGHALGLAGHSMSNQDIMFYSETPALGPVLSQRDSATIQRLYGNYPPAPPVVP